MDLIIGTVWTQIENATEEEIESIDEALSVDNPGARFSNAFKYGKWDGKARFLNRRSLKFPTGLVRRVLKICKALPTSVQPFFRGTVPEPTPRIERLVQREARPYQNRAAGEAVRRVRVALQVPTSGGKTLIGAEIIRRLGLRSLWIINRKQLADQTQSELSMMLGFKVGFIGGGKKDVVPEATVAVVQTLVNFHKDDPFWSFWDVIIVDECHTVSTADSWYDVSLKFKKAWYRIGLSGTTKVTNPIKQLKLEACTGPTYSVVEIDELIDSKFLARPDIRMLRAPAYSFPTIEQARDAVVPDWRQHPIILKTAGGEVHKWVYEKGIVENAERNSMFLRIALRHAKAGERVLILASRIYHVDALAEMLSKKIDNVWHAHSKCSNAHRENALLEFRNSKYGILVAGKIFDAGMDIPEIDVMLQMGGGKDPITNTQRLGRALRKREDKDTVIYYDGYDGVNPDKPTGKDYLALHTRERLLQYQEKGFPVKIVIK